MTLLSKISKPCASILAKFLWLGIASIGSAGETVRFQGKILDTQGLPVYGYLMAFHYAGSNSAQGPAIQIGPGGNFDIDYILTTPTNTGILCLDYSTTTEMEQNIFCLDFDHWVYLSFGFDQNLGGQSPPINLERGKLPETGFQDWCGMRIQKKSSVFSFDGTRAWCPDSHERLSSISSQGFSNGNLVSNGSFEGGSPIKSQEFGYPRWNSDRLRSDGGAYWLNEAPDLLKPIDGTRIAAVRMYGGYAGTNLNSESGYLASDRFPITPGSEYSVGFRYSRKQPANESGGTVRPRIQLFSSLTSGELPAGNEDLTGGWTYIDSPNEWQSVFFHFTATESSNFARLELLSPDNISAGGLFYFDNVIVTQRGGTDFCNKCPDFRGSSSVTYVDGMGLPIETRSRMTPDWDVYSQTEYDELLRPIKSSLPLWWTTNYQTSFNGFLPDIFGKANNYYSGDPLPDAGGFAFSETVFESSPLGRPFVQSSPGATWQLSGTHTLKSLYSGSSDLNEPLSLPAAVPDGAALYSYSLSMDPESKQSRTFTDKFGRMLRSSVFNGTAWVNSDYEYDPNGNLTKEIAPEGPGGSRNATLKTYNTMGMPLTEESPDLGKSILIYDASNRLRFTQSQVQRAALPQRFSYFKYDDYNRSIESGESLDGASFTQANADNAGFPFKFDSRTLPRTFSFYDELPGNKNYCEDVPGTMNIIVRSDANPNLANEFTNLNSAYDFVQGYISGFNVFWGKIRINQVFDNTAQLISPINGSNFAPFSLMVPAEKVPFTLTALLRNSGPYNQIVGGGYPFNVAMSNFKGQLAQTVTCNTDLIGEAPGMKQISKVFNYDKYGRVLDVFEYNGYIKSDASKWERTSFVYNISGQLIKREFYSSASAPGNPINSYVYHYSPRGELTSVNEGPGIDGEIVAEFNYLPDGSVKEKRIGDYDHQLVTTLKYNPRGWLVTAQVYGDGPLGLNEGLVLNEDIRYDWGPNAKYDGNISKYIVINKDDVSKQWDYIYNPLNRLKNAILYTNGNILNPEIFTYTYHDNGALNTVAKYGNLFTYNYETYQDAANATRTNNRLKSVFYNGAYSSVPGIIPRDTRGYDNFQYDASGRLRLDISKNLNVDFGDNDRPFYFNHYSNGNSNSNTEFMVYDDGGRRKSKISYVNGNWLETTHYLDNGKQIRESASNPTEVYFPYDAFGKMLLTTSGFSSPEVYVKNYLGSTVYAIDLENQAYRYQSEYEPYGKLRNEVSTSGGLITEKFTSKEHDDGIDLDYFGARYYDPDIGLWISPDPARQYASPYAYTPNPVNETDPDGRFVPAVLAAIATWIFMSPVEVGENAQPDRLPETAGELAEVGVIGVIFHKLGGPRGRAVGPTIDQKTGSEVGRFIVDSKGNTMIEPVGGSTVPNGLNGQSTHTLYPNGSKYQRLDMVGHPNNPTPHGHGHLQGTGPGMRGQGAPIDATGTIVPSNSAAAHWPIN